ncbi:hypothetical protein GCM10009601_44480 [Streptomyces thermospinosisporus]|uniref:OB domain-containing protein n=1 Tax=Streptomyces thermospinosisporus TaxID=161482 RepID=A0ABN1Z3A9_9ACTN
MIQSRVHVSDLREHVGRTVTVCGWVNALRLQRKMQFVIVRDSTGLVRVTRPRHLRGQRRNLLTRTST